MGSPTRRIWFPRLGSLLPKSVILFFESDILKLSLYLASPIWSRQDAPNSQPLFSIRPMFSKGRLSEPTTPTIVGKIGFTSALIFSFLNQSNVKDNLLLIKFKSKPTFSMRIVSHLMFVFPSFLCSNPTLFVSPIGYAFSLRSIGVT